MLRILRQIRDQPQSTAIIHCSAGIGRTGTIVACEICLKILLEGKDLNVRAIVLVHENIIYHKEKISQQIPV